MKIHYLEIVTPDVDAACALHSQMHRVDFGEAEPMLGGARTAKLASGGMLGIRAPLRPTETPVVRPYFLVEDIKASVAAAARPGHSLPWSRRRSQAMGNSPLLFMARLNRGCGRCEWARPREAVSEPGASAPRLIGLAGSR
jgi:hypothetical protein